MIKGFKLFKTLWVVKMKKQVLKQRGKTALKSFGQSTINQLAINSTQKRKKTQS